MPFNGHETAYSLKCLESPTCQRQPKVNERPHAACFSLETFTILLFAIKKIFLLLNGAKKQPPMKRLRENLRKLPGEIEATLPSWVSCQDPIHEETLLQIRNSCLFWLQNVITKARLPVDVPLEHIGIKGWLVDHIDELDAFSLKGLVMEDLPKPGKDWVIFIQEITRSAIKMSVSTPPSGSFSVFSVYCDIPESKRILTPMYIHILFYSILLMMKKMIKILTII